MRRLMTMAAMTGLALAACSNAEEAERGQDLTASETSQVVLGDQSFSETSAPDTATEIADPSVIDSITEEDLVRFVAATEVALRGTAQEGVVYDSPEVYIALAHASCARFTAGDDFDEIAADMLADLESAGLADQDRLVGAILGAATQTICPEHADKI